jgi:hypothetical protein
LIIFIYWVSQHTSGNGGKRQKNLRKSKSSCSKKLSINFFLKIQELWFLGAEQLKIFPLFDVWINTTAILTSLDP